MNIFSPAFGQNQPIPAKYTCDGENVSPPLVFAAVPPGTKSISLIMDDPDASRGTFIHWLAWNFPPATWGVEEAAWDNPLDGKIVSGRNGFNERGYGGPCPPPGEQHRYFFRLYALDIILDLAAGATHEALNMAMGGHIIAETEFFAVYRRPGQTVREAAGMPEENDLDAAAAEFRLADDEAAVNFPAGKPERIGVRTDKGTDPVSTDQGDEQNAGKLYGTPDDETCGYGTEGEDIGREYPYIK